MSSIQIYQHFSVDIDGRNVRGGSLSEPKTVQLTENEITDQAFKIDASSVVKVWDKSENEAMGAFAFLWMESDLDVLVQFTTDAGVTDVYSVKELKESGPALVLASDAAKLLDGSIDAFDGTDGTIDEIWVSNPSSDAIARVRVVVAV